MNWRNILMKVILFGVAVPLINKLPHSYSLLHRTLFIGLIFAAVNSYAYKTYIEGFENPDTRVDQPCPPGYVKCKSGDCKLKTDLYGMC